MKSLYSFQDRGIDRRNQFWNALSKTFQMIAIWHACQSWKLVGDEENNIPPRYTRGETQLQMNHYQLSMIIGSIRYSIDNFNNNQLINN